MLKAHCPSYDAIAGIQPASYRVLRHSSIDFHIIIEEVHTEECLMNAAFISSDTTHGSGSGFTSANGPGFLACSKLH